MKAVGARTQTAVLGHAGDLLRAARDELDAIVAEGVAPDAAERLNSAAGLIEEAMAEIEGRL